MSRRPSRLPRIGPALLIFIFALGVYAATQGPDVQGYEAETAAVAEGFVRTGTFTLPADYPHLAATGQRGRNGELVGRAGLPQELLEAPFALAGLALDRASSSPDPRRWRAWTVLFYNPAVVALCACLLFLLVRRLRRSVTAGIAVGVAFTVATLAWPYAKAGMDTTAMLGVLLAFLGALRARDCDDLPSWALAGFGAGLAVAAKPSAFPAGAAGVALPVPLSRGGGPPPAPPPRPLPPWLRAL